MNTIAAFLSERLDELDEHGLAALALMARVDLAAARRARSGEPVKAADALKLLAARGYDPVTRKAIAPMRLGRFDHDMLRLFMRAQMMARHHTYRAAAEAMGSVPSTVNNIRIGRPVSLANTLKACAYLGLHPFEFCECSREAKAA